MKHQLRSPSAFVDGLAASLCIVALATTSRGDVSLFEGASGGPGNVRIIDELGISPPRSPVELQGIQLLVIDASGRSPVDRLFGDRPRLRDDVPGASRILLPFSKGSLYRYRRDEMGGATFGYFVIGPDGAARSLVERPGTGAFGTDDPFPGKIGLAPDGDAFLVATSAAAGGDLLEVDVPTGTTANRSGALGPMDTLPGGVRLLTDWGVALTARGALRFDRAPSAEAAFVPLGVERDAIRFVGDGIVSSTDQSTVAFAAGSIPGQAHVFTFQRTGAGTRVTQTPSSIRGAGFLPAFTHGPTLALAPDGSSIAWRTEGASTEAWIQSTAPDAPAPFQITDDVHFEDTLSETGAIGFLAGKLVLFVGSPATAAGGGPIGLEDADIYQVDPATNAVTNLSLTSGRATTPFIKGALNTEEGMWQLPDGSGMLVAREGSDDFDLLIVPWSGAPPALVLGQVKSVDELVVAGSEIVLGTRRSNAARSTDLVRLPLAPGATGIVLSSLSRDCDLNRFYGRDDGTFTAVANCLGSEFLGRAVLPVSGGGLLTSQPLRFGPTIGFTPAGELAASIELVGATAFFVWPAGQPPRRLARVSGGAYALPASER